VAEPAVNPAANFQAVDHRARPERRAMVLFVSRVTSSLLDYPFVQEKNMSEAASSKACRNAGLTASTLNDKGDSHDARAEFICSACELAWIFDAVFLQRTVR